jgi:hypothetical protein
MNKLNLKKIKSQGFSLIELLIAIAFIAVATATIYYIYNKVKASGDANTEGRHLDTLRAGIKGLYASSTSYAAPSAVSNTFANEARITPDAMRVANDTATIKNKFGGTVTIEPTQLGAGAAGNGFRIIYSNVPGEVCVKLVTTAGSQFDQVSVGTTTVKTFGTQSLNPVTTATACNAGDTDGRGVTINFDSL